MYLNNWNQWDRPREEAEQPITCKTFPVKKKLREKRRLWGEMNESAYRDRTISSADMLRHWPAEEAWEGQADGVSITDHAHHLKHPNVLQLSGHMEAVKTIWLTTGVWAHTLHKVRSASLQFTDHLWQWVLRKEKRRKDTVKGTHWLFFDQNNRYK